MRRIIGCTELAWPLDLMTKLEGAPYRADYSGKRAVYHRQFLTGGRRIFYTFSPQSTHTNTHTHIYKRAHTRTHTQTHTHTRANARMRTPRCVFAKVSGMTLKVMSVRLFGEMIKSFVCAHWKYSCAAVLLFIGRVESTRPWQPGSGWAYAAGPRMDLRAL